MLLYGTRQEAFRNMACSSPTLYSAPCLEQHKANAQKTSAVLKQAHASPDGALGRGWAGRIIICMQCRGETSNVCPEGECEPSLGAAAGTRKRKTEEEGHRGHCMMVTQVASTHGHRSRDTVAATIMCFMTSLGLMVDHMYDNGPMRL